MSVQTKEKIAATKRGSLNASWKGDEAGYAAIHNWMLRTFTKTGICELCKRERFTEWANLFGDYRHVREDFIELCVPCHRMRDIRRKRVARDLYTHLSLESDD